MRTKFAAAAVALLALAVPAQMGGSRRAAMPSAGTQRDAAAANQVTKPKPKTVSIAGYGYGHGIGMGQYGAFGYASLYHDTYRWIVEHFYAGTWLERLPAAVDRAPISVDLSELDNQPSTNVKANRPGAHLIIDGKRVKGTEHIIRHTGVVITAQTSAGDIDVQLPGGAWRMFQGRIQVRSDHRTYNILPLEKYVTGVVPSESIAAWGAEGGEAALQAQAVAARAYAIASVRSAGSICDNTACQEYLGDPGPRLGSLKPYVTGADSSTLGQVMCLRRLSPCPVADVATTEYSASTGGWTAGEGFVAEPDRGDAVPSNPYHSWTVRVAVAAIERAYPSVGTLTRLRVTKRNGLGARGGRALTVRITGTRGTLSTTGTDFAVRLGLMSNWFVFATQP